MIKILLDTSSDMPAELREKYGIRWVEFPITFDTEQYLDQKDLSSEEFFKKIADTGILPKTSQVTRKQFEDAIAEMLVEPEDHVLVLPLSSTLSGTYNEAVQAQETFGKDRVTVIDTKVVTVLITDLAIMAGEMIQAGKSLEEIVAAIEAEKGKREAIFVLDTLEFLRKGGRISFAQSVVGGLLNIKVVLRYADGKIMPHDKAKGKKQAFRIMVDYVKENHQPDRRILMVHAVNEAGARELAAMIKEETGRDVDVIAEMGAVIGTHVGPGTIALSC